MPVTTPLYNRGLAKSACERGELRESNAAAGYPARLFAIQIHSPLRPPLQARACLRLVVVRKLSGAFGEAEVRCLGMPVRYAPAETLSNESLNQMETVETEGPRLVCGGASARAGQGEEKHDVGAGDGASSETHHRGRPKNKR